MLLKVSYFRISSTFLRTSINIVPFINFLVVVGFICLERMC